MLVDGRVRVIIDQNLSPALAKSLMKIAALVAAAAMYELPISGKFGS